MTTDPSPFLFRFENNSKMDGRFDELIRRFLERENQFVEACIRKHCPLLATLVDTGQFRAAAIHARAAGCVLHRFYEGHLGFEKNGVSLELLPSPFPKRQFDIGEHLMHW